MMIVVIGRYFFNKIPAWSEEFALFMMSWLAFFGAAIIERDKGHIRISIVDNYYPIGLLRVFSVLRYFIKLIFLCAMTYYGALLTFYAKDTFASVDLSKGWCFAPGFIAGLTMVCILLLNAKKELVDVWHMQFNEWYDELTEGASSND